MAFFSFQNINISGIAVCVPEKTVINSEFGRGLFDDETLLKTLQTTGIEQRRVSVKDICSSDLCFHAAEKLITELNVEKGEISVLIFVSQTPDYRIPATACTLQHRLGLSKSTACFDVNLGCSGYVYGLSIAFSFANLETTNKVLLLVGDTVTKFTSAKDKSSAMLFGDAGSATIIEKTRVVNKSYFSLNTDGSGADYLKINSGAYRNPSSIESLKETELVDGSKRNDEQIFMDGGEIFNFTIREVTKDINALLKFSGIESEQINYFAFHQANKFMLDYLTKKLKCPPEKVLFSLKNFGNTSSASIPVTLVSEFSGGKNELSQLSLLISGFGVGLSWASSIINLNNCHIPDLIKLT